MGMGRYYSARCQRPGNRGGRTEPGAPDERQMDCPGPVESERRPKRSARCRRCKRRLCSQSETDLQIVSGGHISKAWALTHLEFWWNRCLKRDPENMILCHNLPQFATTGLHDMRPNRNAMLGLRFFGPSHSMFHGFRTLQPRPALLLSYTNS